MMTHTQNADTQITALGDGVTAIDTGYMRPLLDASHVIVDGGEAAFVDTGTALSVPRLLAALAALDVDAADVRYVLLTHVHLDHAGGAGALMKHLPNAAAVIHPRGARHMVAPQKLIAGSIAVYGEARFRELYGDVVPIDEQRVIVAADGQTIRLGARDLSLMFTEGHARHHYCIHDPASRAVFSGDSFGISYRELDTPRGEFIFPTTTPVHFDPAAAHDSVDRLLALETERMFLTHYSEVTDLSRLGDDMHAALDAFVAIAREHADAPGRTERIERGLYDWLSARLDEHGFDPDPGRRHAILDMDVELNTQGLEFWLEHAA